MKNTLTCLIATLLLSLFLASQTVIAATAPTAVAQQPLFTISGAVNHPLQLNLNDLQQMQSTTVKYNEVDSAGNFHGVFTYQAVPLQSLLNLAVIEQKNSTFKKPVDATIVISDAKGGKVVVSWGEIYYSNPAEVTIAYRSTAVLPTKSNCARCHTSDEFQPTMDQLHRHVAMPKLLIDGDFYSDRFLEGIVNIEVVDVRPNIPVDHSAKLTSNQIELYGTSTQQNTITSLASYPSAKLTRKVVGVGRGYHGLHNFSGTPLAAVLTAAGVKPRMDQVVLLSAPDGYRSTFSMGELFISSEANEILLADSQNGGSLHQGGNIRLIVGPDNTDDRDVQAITSIEVIDLSH